MKSEPSKFESNISYDFPTSGVAKMKHIHCRKRLRKKSETISNNLLCSENSFTSTRKKCATSSYCDDVDRVIIENSDLGNTNFNLTENKINMFKRYVLSERSCRVLKMQFLSYQFVLFLSLVPLLVLSGQACRYSSIDARHTMCSFMPRQCPGKMLMRK